MKERYLINSILRACGILKNLSQDRGAFKIGDLVLLGTALAWRFTENVQTYPQPSVFLEAHVRHLFRNEEDGERVRNSGGTALFLGPGFRMGFSERVSWTIALQIPVFQHLHSEQQETLFKAMTGLTFTF